MTRARRFAAIYLAWIAICAGAIVLVRNAPDPSHRAGRILPNEAGDRAVGLLRQHGLREYEAVHVAFENNRWIVLCDRVPHTALKDALVVELRALDGSVIRIRKPVE